MAKYMNREMSHRTPMEYSDHYGSGRNFHAEKPINHGDDMQDLGMDHGESIEEGVGSQYHMYPYRHIRPMVPTMDADSTVHYEVRSNARKGYRNG